MTGPSHGPESWLRLCPAYGSAVGEVARRGLSERAESVERLHRRNDRTRERRRCT